MQHGESIHLSSFKLEKHVREAIATALLLAQGSPINAANALNAVLIVGRKRKSTAFSRWVKFFDGVEVQSPLIPPKPDLDLADIPVNSFLAESFRVAKEFFVPVPQTIWGRDYITLALLATGDPSLEEVAASAHLGLDTLRDEWFRFLQETPASRRHRNWADWWKASGQNVPVADYAKQVTAKLPDPPPPDSGVTSAPAHPNPPAQSSVPEPAAQSQTVAKSATLEISPTPPSTSASPNVQSEVSPQVQSQTSAQNPPPTTNEVPKLQDARAEPPKTPPAAPDASSASAGTSRLPDVWMLSDRPISDHFAEQDQFQFQDYANALAAVLDHEKTETPFTMAINAPWGAGKTTLANMIAEQLRQRPRDRGVEPHIICWFNAWMHDDAPNLATAFIAEVGRTANRSRKLLARIVNPLPEELLEPKWRNRRRLLVRALIFLPALLALIWAGRHLEKVEEYMKWEAPRLETIQKTTTATRDLNDKPASSTTTESHSSSSQIDRIKNPDKNPVDLTATDRFFKSFQSQLVALGALITGILGMVAILSKAVTSTALGGFVESPGKAAEAGEIAAANSQLEELIAEATWRDNRFVVFIDDIERCKPPRSVDVLDAVNQLMNHKNVVVVILGDMSAVAAAAQLKYKDIAEIFVPSGGIALSDPDRGKEAFGRLYLQKIIQFQFDLPVPPTDQIRGYMQRLAVVPKPPGGTNAAA